MGYPRQCPSCEIPYAPPFEGTATVETRAGGAADRGAPGRPGALLLLSCRDCGERYWWDFFAGALTADPS
jgi:hypothetical protein